MMMGLGAANIPIDVADVFSPDTYSGNAAGLTVTNGVNFSSFGGMLWTKQRNSVNNHWLNDTARGANNNLTTVSTSARAVYSVGFLSSFNTNGYSISGNTGSFGTQNDTGGTYASWSFRKAPRFLDVVTYTGTGAARTVAHSLAHAPGMVVVKCTSTAGAWAVYHRANTAAPETDFLILNSTAATSDLADYWNDTVPTGDAFTVGTHANVNANGASYVAYVFAHDTYSDGVMRCDSFATDGSGAGSFDLGWAEGVQFILLKCASDIGDWEMYDTSRTASFSGDDARLIANTTAKEDAQARLSFSGTTLSFAGLSASQTYIFAAVRAE